MRKRLLIVLPTLLWLLAAASSQAATFTVSKTADTNDGTCNADCSLREAIVAANGNGSADTIAFSIPLTDPGYNAGTGVFTLGVSTALQAVSGPTTIDGTTQTANRGNTNPGVFGTGGTVGVGADSVAGTGDEPSLPQVAAPEIELRATATVPIGLHIRGSNSTVRGLAVVAFGVADGDAAIRVDNGASNVLIEDNVIGSGAAAFSDPGGSPRGHSGIHIESATNGTVQNNLIGFVGVRAIWMQVGVSGWTVQGNELLDAGLDTVDGDGIAINGASSNSIVANRITGSSSQGLIVTFAGSNNNTITDNTVTGNGVGISSGLAQSAGVTIRSSGGSTVFERNYIHANHGAGLQVNSGASGIRMSRNAFANNGTIVARNGNPPTGQIGIDLNASGDDGNFGSAPFYTINDNGDSDSGGNNRLNFPVLDTAAVVSGNMTLTGWARPGSTIELFVADSEASGFGEGEIFLATMVEGSGADTDATTSSYGSGAVNGILQGTDTTNRFSFTIATPTGVVAGTRLTATATVGANTSEFSGVVTATAVYAVTGRVFEDADFAGTAAGWDGGANDLALPNVDVELYTAANAFVSSTVTDGAGIYSFSVADGSYKVRVRCATIGDANTPPAGGFNAACGISDPATGVACTLAEQTWGDAAAVYGGQSATTDDTATANNAGPGNTWLPVTVAGAVRANLDFGFAYNLIVNTADAGQGSLRRFIANANAIGAANGTSANSSEFRLPLTDPGYNGGTGVFTIALASVLPAVADANTTIDGQTQTDNVGDSNAGAFIHPNYGAVKSVGTGADGIQGNGDELVLPAYALPDIELDGNDQGVPIELAAAGGVLRHLAIFNAPSFATGVLLSGGLGNLVEGNYIGLRADGTDPAGAGRVNHGIEVFGGTATVRNNVVAYTQDTAVIVEFDSLIEGNEIFNASIANASGDGISAERTTGQSITVRRNRVDFSAGYALETWRATGPFTIEDNTFSRSGQGGGVENGGVRVFGTGSTVLHNVIASNAGAGVSLGQRGTPGSNRQNVITQNAIYANGGLAIDQDVTNTGVGDNANGDGVTSNNGSTNATLPNAEMDYPVFTSAALSGSSLFVTGYVGTAGSQLAGPHTLEFFRADDDGNNSGEIETGDALSVAHGEGRWYIDSCASAASGFFSCTLVVPPDSPLSVGQLLSATARNASGDTSEFGANATVTSDLIIRKRAFRLDGTPIASGATMPVGIEFKFLLYINNRSAAANDISLQDVLDPGFAYQPGTLQVDNSVVSCAAQLCTPVEETAVFSAAVSAPALTDTVDADVASFAAAVVDVGNQNAANGQLDIAGSRVLAVVFSAKLQ